MKICILSDSHDNRGLLYAAVEEAKARGAEAVLHCGDVVAPSTLSILKPLGVPVHVIHGNNTGDLYMLTRMAGKAGSNVHYYGQDAGFTLAGRRVFLVHYPHYARALATTGDWDLVCCGHDHVANIDPHIPTVKGGTTMLVNPGTVGGVNAPPTYVLGDLETMQFEIVELQPTAADVAVR